MTGDSTRPGWYEAGLDHIWLPYAQMKTARPPLPVVRTEGCRIVLADGRELIDGIASWWTACHGYNHPHIRAAVERQLAAMPHVMFGGLVHEQALTLARRLAALLPGDLDRVFFSESGSVAVEVAMKMAVQYWLNRGVRGRSKFVAFKGGYHGDTTGAMAVSDRRRHARDVPRTVAGACRGRSADGRRARRGAVASCSSAMPTRSPASSSSRWCRAPAACCFTMPTCCSGCAQLADRYDLLLIFDEIFTGFGRTGTMFACEQAGVVPDIITVGKALTGGTLPLAATIARRKVFDAFWSDDPKHALMHGPTFMANALACAAANASLDLFEREPRLEQVRRISAALAEGLAPCREMPRRQGRAREGRHRRGRAGTDRRSRCAAGALRGGGRVHPPVRTMSSI